MSSAPSRVTRRRWRFVVLGAVIVALAFLIRAWKANGDRGGQLYAEPFRIAGNFYFVGANDVSAFLLTGPQGHILLDGGYPGTPPLILASIAKLGFDIRDVKVLINSEPHSDHAGGLAALQQASGAELWASAPSADAIESGGNDPDIFLPMRALIWSGLFAYPAARVEHRIRDGDTVRVGPVAVVANITGGHTRGCTSWSFPVQEGDRVLHVVSACSLVTIQVSQYPAQRADFVRTFARLRSLPADIWVTSHGRLWGRYRKFAARDTARSAVQPFIDPQGYRAYIDSGEARLRRGHMQ